jgi:peptide/histidine transporter 3/4
MSGWRNKWRWYLLSNKEIVFIIVLYAIYALCYATSVHGLLAINTAALFTVFVPTIVFYCGLGLVGEVFIGRHILINFSLWVQWIAMMVSAVVSAMMYSLYDFPQWMETLLVAVPSVVQFFGLAAFQVTAIQYGIDLIQGAPSKHLSAFIYWYFCMPEFVIPTVLAWVIYLLSKYALVTDIAIQLGCSLLCSFLLSFVLCVKNLFMSHWLRGNPENDTSLCCWRKSHLAQRNPCSLIYHVLKFAIKHKNPLQRSAFTYWEDKLPSRIDLGKNKYGGPFTSEEVENVKTFLRLLKLLMSLLGIYVVAFAINLDAYHRIFLASSNSIVIANMLCDVANVAIFLLLYIFLLLPCCHKCLPKMLKRIWIGAMFTVASAVSMLLVESITSVRNKIIEQVPCMVTLSPYLLLIPKIFEATSYIIFTISLFEFIIAQSPQTMKGILIGLFYTLRFGLVGLFLLAEYHAFGKYPTHGYVLNCAIAHHLEITLIGLPSLFIYTIVAYKYKLRERDEIVNVHIFAEEYYTKS